jgi:hypothetical protein
MRHYSFARLEFARKNYDKALDNLIKVKYEFFLFKIDVKDLMFKIYFEMGLYENAISVLNTMRQYVEHTSDLSESFKTGYRNFIKFGNALLKMKLSGNKNDGGLVERNIVNENNLFSRQWLLEKVSSI